MFVYIIVNDVNLKIYIGKTTTSNLTKYLQSKVSDALGRRQRGYSHLFNSIRKYGREHFHIFPLFKGTTNEEICSQEKLLIKALATQNHDIGYNICRGGEGFTGSHTEETLRKMRQYKPSDDTRQKMSKGQIGRVHPPETRCKISKAMKGTKRCLGKKNALGYKHTLESKQKISAAGRSRKGEKRSPFSGEHRRKISEALQRRPVSEETRRKISIGRSIWWAAQSSISKNAV